MVEQVAENVYYTAGEGMEYAAPGSESRKEAEAVGILGRETSKGGMGDWKVAARQEKV
jgi:hypothetical protein